MGINLRVNWDKWEGIFLIKHPIKYAFLSYKWPISQWINYAGINSDSKIMEAGCGGGGMGLFFAVRHFKVTFSDASKVILEDCRENICRVKRFFSYLDASSVCQDIFEMAFKDNAFDLIISDGVYEHNLDIETRRKSVTEMMRVVKDGGSILISIPNGQHPFLRQWKAKGRDYSKVGYEYREIEFNREEFKKELESFGLYDVILDGWQVYESFYAHRMFLWRVIGNIIRFFLPCICQTFRIKFGESLYALWRVKKEE